MSDSLSQEEIDRLLAGAGSSDADEQPADSPGDVILTDEEKDIIGEIGNISMGSAATTLSTLVGRKVEITTPQVEVASDIRQALPEKEENVTVEIKYTIGLEGTTIFCLNVLDTCIIADLMMGGAGEVAEPQIDDLRLSAVGEAMNQMIGTVSTTLSSMIKTSIDITPPITKHQKAHEELDLTEEAIDNSIVAIKFNFKVEGLIDSEMIQIMTYPVAKTIIEKTSSQMGDEQGASESAAQKNVESIMEKEQGAQPSLVPSQNSTPPPSPSSQQSPPPPVQSEPPPQQAQQQAVTVQPVQFSSFDNLQNVNGAANQNLDLLMDVKLKLNVELGRTELSIKKILELTRGSVIELNKVAGEPVELFVNGKLIAKGEVVVIEDNFGLRITNIVSPENRLKDL